ncbi:MAG: NAD-dependent epimerase/dehydratase family protein [Oscillospiraceae bacterium]|jgi:dihydroflavonol-4-reductase
MNKLYLITGATGHLGTTLIHRIGKKGPHIRALVLPGDLGEYNLPDYVEVCSGDVTDMKSLERSFKRDGYDTVTLIHCAAIVSISSGANPAMWEVNVNGTDNVMKMAVKTGVERVVYVSSVHAITEKAFPNVISEQENFDVDAVKGGYAKTKAAAANLVLDYAKKGLNVSIVHPSGIIGPGDFQRSNNMIRTIEAVVKRQMPCAVEGGYDFVDVRDVADGILSCETYGRKGECYILSGHYSSIKHLMDLVRNTEGRPPVAVTVSKALAKAVAPIGEWFSKKLSKKPLLTPYSVYTLESNSLFSHKKASKELGYKPRSLMSSVRDTVAFLLHRRFSET